MERIAFVVHRYGMSINGGAEYHCRQLAERLTKYYNVDVLTSTAMSCTPWNNYFEEGCEQVNNVNVIRFQVERPRNEVRFRVLDSKVRQGDEGCEEEWFEEMGPFCPKLVNYAVENTDKYKAFILFVYSSYTTVACLKKLRNNTILIPTAHEEPHIYLPMYKKIFGLPKAYLFNTTEEKQLISRVANIEGKKSHIKCAGIDKLINDPNMKEKIQFAGEEYVIYVGRVSDSKNYKELNRFFIEYKKRNPGQLKMIVIGRMDDNVELIYSSDIIYVGFVSESEKAAYISGAKTMIMPSLMESLSLVILESMMLNTPILVNGNCDVLREQCKRSNSGLYYNNYYEFEKALNYILNNNDAYEQMQRCGKSFVENEYNWDDVITDVHDFIEEVADNNGV